MLAVLVGAVLRLWDLGTGAPEHRRDLHRPRRPASRRRSRAPHRRHRSPRPDLLLLLRPVAAVTTDVGGLRAVSALGIRRRPRHHGDLAASRRPRRGDRDRRLRRVAVPARLWPTDPDVRPARACWVTAVWSAQRWLADGRTRWTVIATGAGLVAALTHGTGVLLLVCLLALPHLRRDRAVWVWSCHRAALAVFSVLWGAHTLTWSHASGGLPTASPTGCRSWSTRCSPPYRTNVGSSSLVCWWEAWCS